MKRVETEQPVNATGEPLRIEATQVVVASQLREDFDRRCTRMLHSGEWGTAFDDVDPAQLARP